MCEGKALSWPSFASGDPGPTPQHGSQGSASTRQGRDLSWSLRGGGGPGYREGRRLGQALNSPFQWAPGIPGERRTFADAEARPRLGELRVGGRVSALGAGTASPGSQAGISWWGSGRGSAVGPPTNPGRGGGGELRFCPPALLGHFQSPGPREAQSMFPRWIPAHEVGVGWQRAPLLLEREGHVGGCQKEPAHLSLQGGAEHTSRLKTIP